MESHLRVAREMYARRDFEGFIEQASRGAAIAEEIGDGRTLYAVSNILQRSGLFEHCWRLRIATERLRRDGAKPEWDGSDLSGLTILLCPNIFKNRIGQDMRFSRFIGPVARQAGRCIVLAESRMVPILRRSFPSADIRAGGVDDAEAWNEADVVAHFGTLAWRFARSSGDLARSLVPFRADPQLTASIRDRYLSEGAAPLVGIAWTSKRTDRDVPDLDSWAPLLGANNATFVSLQYGDYAADLATLTKYANGRLIQDRSIDQLRDLDSFAAQITALDAVISITNTTIDMAGSLHIPTVQIRDDRIYGMWPSSGPSAWYPDIIPVYRNRRPWPEVTAEAAERLSSLIATAASNRAATPQ